MNIYTLIHTPLSFSELDATEVRTTSNLGYAITHLSQGHCNSVLVRNHDEALEDAVTYTHHDLDALKELNKG